MFNSNYRVLVITLIGIFIGQHQSAAQQFGVGTGFRADGGGFPGQQLFQGLQDVQGLNGRRFGGSQFDGLQLGGQLGGGRGQLGTLGTNGIGIDRFGTGGSIGGTRFGDSEFGGRFGTGLAPAGAGRTRFLGDTFQGGRGTATALGGNRFGGNGLRLAGTGVNGLNGIDGMRAATVRARLGAGRLGQTLGGTRLGTAGTGIGINGLGTTGLGTRFNGATTALQGVRRVPTTNTLRRRLGTGAATSPAVATRGRTGFPLSDGTVTIQSLPDTMWIPAAANNANDGFSLNQVDLSQFTTNLDALGATGLDGQPSVFMPAATLQSSQSSAATLAAQETARAAAAQQQIAILNARRNLAAVNAAAAAAAAATAAGSQTARIAVATQAERSAAAAEAARAAAAAQIGISAGSTQSVRPGTLQQGIQTVATDLSSAASGRSLTSNQPARRRGPIFAIVPLTSRANIDDMRKFVRELSASISMASNEPSQGDNALQTGLLPLTNPQERGASVPQGVSIAGDSLPPVTPVRVINTVSAESNIPGEGPVTILSDEPFAVPIPIQDPSARQAVPVSVSA